MIRTVSNRYRGFRAGLVAAIVAGCLPVAAAPASAAPSAPAAPEGHAAPARTARRSAVIKDSYIVVLRTPGSRRTAASAVAPGASELAARYGGRVARRYEHALHGFEVTLGAAAAKKLAADPAVALLVPNSVVHIDDAPDGGVQRGVDWGLDRIDDRNLPDNFSYGYRTTAADVHAYVIDSGVRTTHEEFGGRASSGWDFIDNDADATDCHGHGTHVAGTIAGTRYGVAKGAHVVGVRVADCTGDGTVAGVIAGVDWVTANAVKPAVANMSLGVDGNAAVDLAVQALVESGVTVTVSAGNEYAGDACAHSPARVPAAITVGSTDRQDRRSDFSNIGTCLDLFAPGTDILSAWGGPDRMVDGVYSDTGVRSVSGTSMAAPHVAGAAALVLAEHPDYTAAQVRDALVDDATADKVVDAGTGSPNRLLHTWPTPRDFDLKVTGAAFATRGGQPGSLLVDLPRKGDASQWVHLSVTGVPAGATASFYTADIGPYIGRNTTLTIDAPSAEPGRYPLTITAAGTEDTHSIQAYLYVKGPQFTLTATPTPFSAPAGRAATTTITSTLTDGPSQRITLSARGLPPGATATFEPATLTTGSDSSTVSITTPATLVPGRYYVEILAAGEWDSGASTTAALDVTRRTDGCQITNDTDVALTTGWNPPPATSAVTIAGCGRQGLVNSTVEVHVKYRERAGLMVRLVAPDGTTYQLREQYADFGENLDTQYVVDLAGKRADGTWKLVAYDPYGSYAGTIDGWTLTV